jgi:hypothetical protein
VEHTLKKDWWLLSTGALTTMAGLTIAALPFVAGGVHAFFALGGLSEAETPGLRLSCGMLGGLMAAIGVLVFRAATAPALVLPLRDALVWWFIIDSAVSMFVAPLNVVINVGFALLLFPPLRRASGA